MERASELPLMLSIPTTATSPMKPSTNPANRVRCQTVLSPCIDAKIVAQIGTEAIRSPASPDEIFCSAVPIRIQGPIISKSAYGATYLIPRSAGMSCFCLIAIGIKMAAPIAVRRQTTIAGVNPLSGSTATLINRYGIPQRKPTKIKRNQPRLDTP